MFGENPIRKRDTSSGEVLWTQEVFYTIQGEGPFNGEPAVFVRLAGCNLACYFCDTDFESSTWKPTVQELVNKIADAAQGRTRLVVLTGGEPLRQNIALLLTRLFRNGYRVQIETSGSLWQETLSVYIDAGEELTVVCSPKTGRLANGFRAHAYKYIISASHGVDADGLPANSTQQRDRKMRLARPPVTFRRDQIYVQPMDEYDAALNAANLSRATELALQHGYRLCVQMHKLAGVP